VSSFEPGESRWIDRLGNLRNVIRQELIARQLSSEVRNGMTVLDVGCGQGTQVLRLASAGCRVTGVDPSEELLKLCSDRAASEGLDIELLRGRISDLDELFADRRQPSEYESVRSEKRKRWHHAGIFERPKLDPEPGFHFLRK